MATSYTFQIRVIKNQITACLREIAKGVKSFVDRLIVLEGQLEKLLVKQEAKKVKQLPNLTGSEKQIAWAEKIRETVLSLIENKEAIALENAKERVFNSRGNKTIEEALAMVLKEEETPKLKQGAERIHKLESLVSASDWINCFKDVDLSWNGYIKTITALRSPIFNK